MEGVLHIEQSSYITRISLLGQGQLAIGGVHTLKISPRFPLAQVQYQPSFAVGSPSKGKGVPPQSEGC